MSTWKWKCSSPEYILDKAVFILGWYGWHRIILLGHETVDASAGQLKVTNVERQYHRSDIFQVSSGGHSSNGLQSKKKLLLTEVQKK